MEIAKEKTVLTNSWYSKDIYPQTVDLDEHLRQNYSKALIKLASKISLVKNFLFFLAGRKFDIVIAPLSDQGVYYFLMFEALFSAKRNRVIMLEFIRAKPENKLLQAIYPVWVSWFFSPILRKTLLRAQVLTADEIGYYSNQFNVSGSKFRFIPWPLHFNIERKPEVITSESFKSVMSDEQYVMVSGLGNVDWETIFEVAERSDWHLLAVCSKKHLQRVNDLNKNQKARVLNDISQYEHALYVKQATVYALCLEEYNVSVGQIRLMNTIENGVPVVATDVAGLRGYAVDGVNALVVPPNNVTAFKTAVDRLMNNPELRKDLVKSARDYQTSRTFENYIDQVSALLQNAKENLE